jgi:3-hydroxy-3-methylglutaryl CoA synthase
MPEEISKATDYPAERIRNRLGINRIRLPTYSQTNATLTADVLHEFVRRVAADPVAYDKLKREPICKVRYATESNADRARPDLMAAVDMARSKLFAEDRERYKKIFQAFKKTIPSQVTFACAGGGIATSDAVPLVSYYALRGRPYSELVITADTAIYEDKTAQPTQGCAVTLSWITTNPALTVIGDMFGGASEPEVGFTKYGEPLPKVAPKTSMVKYGELNFDAFRNLFELIRPFKPDFLLGHVPFPDQAYDLHAQYRLHVLRAEDPELLRSIATRIGPEPLPPGIHSFSHLVKKVEKRFNNGNGTPTVSSEGIIAHLETDPDINAHIKWVYKLRGLPEIAENAKQLHLPEALVYPSDIGNSYSSASTVAEASLMSLTRGPMRGIKMYFGSGGVSVASALSIVATQEAKANNLIILIEKDDGWEIKGEAYPALHAELSREEKARTTKNGGPDLVQRDLELLRGRLPFGFHVRSVTDKGQPDAVFIDEKGVIKEVPLRY